MISLILVVAFVACAVLYRIRGGYDPFPINGTQAARAMWCIPVGAYITSMVWGTVPLNFTETAMLFVYNSLALFLGLMIPHAFGQAYPVQKDKQLLRAAYMDLVGSARVALALSGAFLFPDIELWHFVVAVLAGGAAHSLAYLIGWQIPVPAGWSLDNKKIVDAPTAWAELLWGGFQGVIFTVFWLAAF